MAQIFFLPSGHVGGQCVHSQQHFRRAPRQECFIAYVVSVRDRRRLEQTVEAASEGRFPVSTSSSGSAPLGENKPPEEVPGVLELDENQHTVPSMRRFFYIRTNAFKAAITVSGDERRSHHRSSVFHWVLWSRSVGKRHAVQVTTLMRPANVLGNVLLRL